MNWGPKVVPWLSPYIYTACIVSNKKSKYRFGVHKTSLDFDLVHWVQEARVGSEGGRSGRDKQFLMSSCDKRSCYSSAF